MSRAAFVLGIDGGGTKSTGLIADPSGNVVSRQTSGATNPNVVGLERSIENLFELISLLCEDAGCAVSDIRSSVVGLAGARSTELKERIAADLAALFTHEGSKPLRVNIETDARIALEGAFDGGPGVVIIAGTGSVVIAKANNGEIISVGGWGRILGDEGSGYAIGREALRAITLMYDRRGEQTALKAIVEEKFGWTAREDLVNAVYQENFDIASIAPIVMDAAINHDLTSQRILQNAAAQMVDQLRSVVMHMGLLRKVPVCLCGGMLEESTVYSSVLQIKIMKSLPQVDIRKPVQSPVHGAVCMAIERIRKT
jgi:N-acetylglucosamine kinase-like BadF-type ATPase